jgi:hypothetical protein
MHKVTIGESQDYATTHVFASQAIFFKKTKKINAIRQLPIKTPSAALKSVLTTGYAFRQSGESGLSGRFSELGLGEIPNSKQITNPNRQISSGSTSSLS